MHAKQADRQSNPTSVINETITQARDARLDGQALSDLIDGSGWGRDLSVLELARVRSDTTWRVVPAGDSVCHKGDPASHWYGVERGLVTMNVSSADGRRAAFAAISAGGWFGEGTLLKNENRRYDITAVHDTRLACMPRSTFVWLLDNSRSFSRFLLAQLNERLAQFISMVEDERLLGTDTRVARSLSALFHPSLCPNAATKLHLSQEQIATICGVSRQRAHQALHVLQGYGLLRLEYGVVRILDVEGLRRFGD